MNLHSFKSICISLFFFVGTTTHAIPPTLGIGLLHSPSELAAQKAFFEAQGSRFTLLPDLTRKFENDNLIVQFYHPAVNTTGIEVVNQDASISVPAKLSFESLMEALIKIRTAKTLGASEVSVFSQIPFNAIEIEGPLARELEVVQFFAVAGADYGIQAGARVDFDQKKPTKNLVTHEDFWIGSSNHPDLLAETADLLGKKPYTFEELLAAPEELRGRRIYWMVASEAPINDHFFLALAQASWMSRQGASVHLITPYLFYSRSDKPEFDVGVTTQGRLIADLIESTGVHGITVVRAHAPQSLGFFKIHSKEITSRPTLIEFLSANEVDCIISPDAGFQKDATKFQHDLAQVYSGAKQVSLVVMNKERDFEGRERILGGTGIENIAGKTVAIVDDETASGGTLDQVAKMIQGHHPRRILAVVTHLAGHATKATQSAAIEHIVVTNTLPIKVKHEKLTVLSIARELAADIAHAEANRTR